MERNDIILVDKRIKDLIRLGQELALKLESFNSDTGSELKTVIINTRAENPWFTEESVITALKNWIETLHPNELNNWVLKYKDELYRNPKKLNIAVINAGNIPFVGLHDLLSVFISGFNYIGKNAAGDSVLLPYIASILCAIEPSYKDTIRFVSRLENMDAVIATGTNNSARYFEYYFGKYPHIIRSNRNGIGVLLGNESNDQLYALGKDVFTYFGLGCRNVSKLYVPVGYDFSKFFESIEDFKVLMSHNKYMNNFDYNNSVFLLKQIPFLQNGFLIVRKENKIASPIAVLHFEEYENINGLISRLTNSIEQLQCISSGGDIFTGNTLLENINFDFGKTQTPALWNYADGVDTLEFLCGL